MRVALVVGHHSSSPGAVNDSGLSEFEVNTRLALQIWSAAKLAIPGDEVVIVFRRTLRTLPGDINALRPAFSVALHSNAAEGNASGTETLYYHRSESSRELAGYFQSAMVEALGLPDRGLKPISREDRGGWVLSETKAPMVLCEPYFIDHAGDFRTAMANGDEMVGGFLRAIVQSLASVRMRKERK